MRKSHRSLSRIFRCIVAIFVSSPLSSPTLVAQESLGTKSKRVIEEVIVTAQKREEVSQDVPISMSVISENFIKDKGITDLSDALLFVPNFKIVEIANAVSPQCRGFLVDQTNPAFEPPCGLALDGVAYARAAYFSAALFDIQRIEVLRGPQGTTFGKNTTAGVVSVVSRDPTDEFSANVDLRYGEQGALQRRAEVAVGGPLIPGVINFRVAGLREKRDGYMENTYADIDPSVGKTAGGRDRTTYRAKFHFLDVWGSSVKLLHERTDLESLGLVQKAYPEEGSAWAQYIRDEDPNASFDEDYKLSNLGGSSRSILTRTQGEWVLPLKAWDLTLLAATGKLSSESALNLSTAPEPFVSSRRSEENPFFTAEIRATSPDFDGLFGVDELFGIDLGSSHMLIGIFTQTQELKDLNLNVELFYAGTIRTLGAASGVFIPSVSSDLINTISMLSPVGSVQSESSDILFNQTAETNAIFGQFTWNLTDKLSLDLGGRFSRETKDADWILAYSQPAPVLNPDGNRGFVAERSLSSETFQPKVSVGYELTDNINLFAHWARAIKGGGFNTFLPTGNPERDNATRDEAQTGSLSFDEEVAEEWGLDAKMMLLDGQMQFNISLFRLDVEDFQVLSAIPGSRVGVSDARLPDGTNEVTNAAKARAQGVEMDLTYLAADWLTVIATVGYNDTEFLSYEEANCPPSEDPNESGFCDRTGYPFPFSPEWNNTLTLDVRFPLLDLWGGLEYVDFLIGGTVEYVSSSYLGLNLDDCCVGESRYRYRAHIGVANQNRGWAFRVTGLNLTNEYNFATQGFDAGITTGAPMPPRTVFAQFSWSY